MWGSVLLEGGVFRAKWVCLGTRMFFKHLGWMAGVCTGWSCLCATLIRIKVWAETWPCLFGTVVTLSVKHGVCWMSFTKTLCGRRFQFIPLLFKPDGRIKVQSSKPGHRTDISLLMFPITSPYLGRRAKKAICGDVVKFCLFWPYNGIPGIHQAVPIHRR